MIANVLAEIRTLHLPNMSLVTAMPTPPVWHRALVRGVRIYNKAAEAYFKVQYYLCLSAWNDLRRMRDILAQSELLRFRTSSIVQNSEYKKTQRFGNWMFPFSGVGRETPTLLGPLQKLTSMTGI
jgi:hypothetical protein